MLGGGTTLAAMLMFLVCGLICGAIYNVLSLVKNIVKNNLVIEIVADLASCFLSGAIFISFVFKYSYGSFELFQVIFLVVGIAFMQIFVKNSFASLILVVYNKIKSRKKLVKNNSQRR